MFPSLVGFCSIPPSTGSNPLHSASSPRGQIRIRHTRRALLSAPCLLPSPLLRVSPHHRPLSLAPQRPLHPPHPDRASYPPEFSLRPRPPPPPPLLLTAR